VKKLSIGLDMGTSKICVVAYEVDTQKTIPLKLGNEKLFPTMIVINRNYPEKLILFPEMKSRPEQEEFIVVDSTKRCVICEWSLQENRKIPGQDCVNYRNYKNKHWCNEGQKVFQVGSINWTPVQLFIQLLEKTLKLTEESLADEYRDRDFIISEIKIGVPMIFHYGQFYVQTLATKIEHIILSVLKNKLERDALIDIVYEPIATLMLHSSGDINRLPIGYFLVIDSGAGTTDIVLCKRQGDRISFVGFDSWNIAGDNYDLEMEEIIKNSIDVAKLSMSPGQKQHYALKNAKEFKEYYCDSKQCPSISIPGQAPVIIRRDEIDREFGKVNKRIADQINSFVSKYTKEISAIRKVYLAGGCIQVSSLVDAISNLIRVNAKDIQNIEIKDPDLSSYDPLTFGVGIGASFPKDRYLKLMVNSLPVEIVVEEVSKTQNRDEYFKEFRKLGTLYEKNAKDNTGKLGLKNIKHDTELILRVIYPNGDRKLLTEVAVNRFYREKKIRKQFELKLEYFVDYNLRIRISASSSHIQEQKEIFFDFIPCDN